MRLPNCKLQLSHNNQIAGFATFKPCSLFARLFDGSYMTSFFEYLFFESNSAAATDRARTEKK